MRGDPLGDGNPMFTGGEIKPKLVSISSLAFVTISPPPPPSGHVHLCYLFKSPADLESFPPLSSSSSSFSSSPPLAQSYASPSNSLGYYCYSCVIERHHENPSINYVTDASNILMIYQRKPIRSVNERLDTWSCVQQSSLYQPDFFREVRHWNRSDN